jgi:hypothetical protein
VTGEYARIARKLGVRELETVVTAPGRQGDSPDRLIDAIHQATGAEVRVVSAEDEGRLAFAGAVSRANPGEGVVAVCDVGGGSTEVVVGTELLGPAWVRSVDLGSLRLTAALLPSDPPTAAEIDAAREAVRNGLAELEPPPPEIALATGGSARTLARVIGHEYGHTELEEVVEVLASRPAAESADILDIRPTRARTLLAGRSSSKRSRGCSGSRSGRRVAGFARVPRSGSQPVAPRRPRSRRAGPGRDRTRGSSAASSGVSQRISSTSSVGVNSPSTRSMSHQRPCFGRTAGVGVVRRRQLGAELAA